MAAGRHATERETTLVGEGGAERRGPMTGTAEYGQGWETEDEERNSYFHGGEERCCP
jgi:hypothetical protein